MTALSKLSRAIERRDRAERDFRQAHDDAVQAAQAYARQSGHFGFTLDAARRTLAFERGRKAA